MQKRKIIALVGLLLFVASNAAFAGASTTVAITAGKEYKGQKGSEAVLTMGRLSTNVSAIFGSTDTSYAVNTHHLNGTKQYGSSDGDTNIYSKDKSAGSTNPDAPGAAGSAAYSDGSWSSL